MALIDSLVSYWKMDEASGNALDAHGSNTLTDNATVGSATGKISTGRDFELDNAEFFSRADNASLSGGDTDFTIAAWVNAESLPAGNHTIVAKYGTTGNQREYWLRYDSGTFTFLVSGDGSTTSTVRATSFGAASLGTWYHVVAWHDSVNNVIGITVNANTATTTAHSTGALDGTASFGIGARLDPLAEHWDGVIDEVGFWRKVLTSNERATLYNGGSGIAYPFTFSATAALTTGGVSLAATATFTPKSTAAASLQIGGATLSAVAFQPGPHCYLETHVGTSQVIAGITSDHFKRNKTGTAKRGARAGIIHLGAAKPEIATLSAAFFVSAFHPIAAGDFSYVSPGQYLRIVNLTDIPSPLIQDGDTTAIPLTPGPMIGFSPIIKIAGIETS